MNAVQDIIVGQTIGHEPEDFQLRLIKHMSSSLLREPSPPCLLRAPTGAGKTFVIGRVLEDLCEQEGILWFWFVPFVNLVQQTEDSLASNCLTMAPTSLTKGRNKEPTSRMVLISTAQGVAKAASRRTGYAADSDDEVRSLANLVARGRAKGLKIGLVVDEAHIGLDSSTEFGKFAKWLRADFLLMASATPKDQRLTDFLVSAGFSAFETFTASRDEVVAARLNKKFIEAVVYDLRKSMQTVTDLQQTVLKQAWKRNQRIKRLLAERDIPVLPLLLVQVGNGAGTVEEARKQLMQLCKVPPASIGEHSADEPNPVLMASIANDTTKEVLIFKQSAGTGFDAPRAFVLASTKPVNDPDFALQFVGRVMRVTQGLRKALPKPTPVPPDLDTAYVYLANAQAQQGFAQAVQATAGLKSQLEGQTEKLVARTTLSGAVVFTNRESDQTPAFYDASLVHDEPKESKPAGDGEGLGPESTEGQPAAVKVRSAAPGQVELPGFDDDQDALDVVRPEPVPGTSSVKLKKGRIASRAELVSFLMEEDIRMYVRTERGTKAPASLKRESKPELADMSAISRAIASKLHLDKELENNAVRAALDRFREKEVHTELTTDKRTEQEVAVVTDRLALSREALGLLRALPQVEDEDVRIVVDVLTKRLTPTVIAQLEDLDDPSSESPETVRKFARDAAYWVVRREAHTMGEMFHEEIAAQAVLEEAATLPDFMVYPGALPLEASTRNIFGVLPPSSADMDALPQVLTIELRGFVTRDFELATDSERVLMGAYDGGYVLNGEERDFARALDRSNWVRWWHRNPDRKPYSVRIVRGEHKNFFHPDFVVCLEHFPGDEPMQRLIETKENVKDAARKSKHVPDFYGQVLFLTKDHSRLRVVNKDGSLGPSVDLDDLDKVREWLRSSLPVQ